MAELGAGKCPGNLNIAGWFVPAATIGTARLTGSPTRERNIAAFRFPNGSGTEIAEFKPGPQPGGDPDAGTYGKRSECVKASDRPR